MTDRAKTSVRGYGRTHQLLRKQLAPIVATGTVACWRCGKLIMAGHAWDLGHDDRDRSVYRGPEHVRCNRGAPNKKRRRKLPGRASSQVSDMIEPPTASRW